MATITKSIGTTGRDYSTVTAWEAANYGAAAGDTAIGECYDDSDFAADESFAWNSNYATGGRTLKAATGQGHGGALNGGVRFLGDGNNNAHYWEVSVTDSTACTIQDLEIDGADYQKLSAIKTTCFANINRLIIHDWTGYSLLNFLRPMPGVANLVVNIVDSFVFNGVSADGQYCTSVYTTLGSGTTLRLWNLTLYNISAPGTGLSYHVYDSGSVTYTQNVMALTVEDGCFYPTSGNANLNYCMSSDTTAYGTGSIDNGVAGNEFVSTVAGSEDLRLKLGAQAINAGIDLGTTADVQFDIEGFDRDTQGVVWDMGGHEYEAVYDPAVLPRFDTFGRGAFDVPIVMIPYGYR